MNTNVPTREEVLEFVRENPGRLTKSIESSIARVHGWEFENNGSYGETSIKQGAVYKILKALESEGLVKSARYNSGYGVKRNELSWVTTAHVAQVAVVSAAIEQWKAEAEEQIAVVQEAGYWAVTAPNGLFYTEVARFTSLGALVDAKTEAESFAETLRKRYIKLARTGIASNEAS